MASKTCVIQEKAARKLFAELKEEVNGASPAKLAKMLRGLPQKLEDEEDDTELSSASEKVLESVVDAVGDGLKIEVVAGTTKSAKPEPKAKAKRGRKAAVASEDDDDDEEEDDEEDEEEETSRRKKGKKSSKKPVKKTKRSSSGGGPSVKDRVFELWLKNPSLTTAKKIAAKFPQVQLSTIRGWMSNWKRGPGDASYPRAAKGRDKEIKAACKRAD